MEITKLNEILSNHTLWLQTNGEQGEKAILRSANLSHKDLRHADLRGADLCGANLRHADLSFADLSGADLHFADLSSAILCYADLYNANLNNTDLRGADLRGADLHYTNLRGADLHNADLDFSAFPLWCGGLSVHIDDKQAKQLLYHLVQNVQYSKNTSKTLKKSLLMKTILKIANQFHRIGKNNIKEIKEE